MREEDGSVTHWIHEVKLGDRDAAQHLWERYFSRLVRLARKELIHTNRRVADEEDLAVSVFERFRNAAENDRFPELADRDGLWRLLVKITARKTIDLQRKQSRKRRGSGKVRGESAFAEHPADEQALANVVGDQPTPEFLATMGEQIRLLFDLLEDQELKEIAMGKMEGLTNKEIAERTNSSVRTIERRLNLIRAIYERELDQESAES